MARYKYPYYRYPSKYPYKQYPTNPELDDVDAFDESILWDESVVEEIKNAYEESEARSLSDFINSQLRFSISTTYPQISRKTRTRQYAKYLQSQSGAGTFQKVSSQISGEHKKVFDEARRGFDKAVNQLMEETGMSEREAKHRIYIEQLKRSG